MTSTEDAVAAAPSRLRIPKKYRSLVLLVCTASVLVALWTVVSADVNSPSVVDVSPSTWQATFEDRGASTDYLVRFSYDRVGDERAVTRGFVNERCVQDQDRVSCRGHVALDSETQVVSIDSGSNDTLDVQSVEAVRQTRRAPFDARWLGRLFVLLLVLSPVFWLIHRWEAASQWLLIGFSVAGLIALQATFAIPLLGLILLFYVVGRWYRQQETRPPRFILSWVLLSVILLLVFKNFKAIFLLPFDQYGSLSLILPLGTSYFLIRLIDLQLRWHRGQLEDLSLRKYLVYLFFPGTIVAGPIEMIDRFFAERYERIGLEEITDGLMRISLGMAKKLILVDLVLAGALFRSGLWADVLLDPTGSPLRAVQFCVLAYLLAYLDFSAYSDIAIGISRLLGYNIVENFNWPILATDLAEFWRRWHISLSGWAFRNIFFPVMVSARSRTLALMATLFVIGLWHGLTLSWVTWGLLHGIGLSVLARIPKRFNIMDHWSGKVAGALATNLYVAAGFAFVSIRDYSLAWKVFLTFISAPVRIFF